MKTATVRDLRYNFPQIEAWLEGGEEIVITKHSKPVAKVSPASVAEKALLRPPITARGGSASGEIAFSARKKSMKCAPLKPVSHESLP